MQFKASFWDFVNCIQLAEGVQEAGVGLVFTDTQDIPLTWDIFCFAVWIAVASIFTGPSKQAKPITKPCPCATRVIFPLDKNFPWKSEIHRTLRFLSKRKGEQRKTLCSHLPTLSDPVRITLKHIPHSAHQAHPHQLPVFHPVISPSHWKLPLFVCLAREQLIQGRAFTREPLCKLSVSYLHRSVPSLQSPLNVHKFPKWEVIDL